MTWLELTQSLLEVTGDVKYADVIERLLFNQVFASQAVDGDCHRVNTPLNGWKPEGYFRRPERPCDCCTSSGHRLISSLPRCFYGEDQDGLFVNQFVPSTIVFDLDDGTAVKPEVIVAATGFSTDLDGLVGHLGVLDEHGDPHGGFASDLGDGMFAIGYGIPPNGPLRAIRLAATPLAGQVAAYLAAEAGSIDRAERSAAV